MQRRGLFLEPWENASKASSKWNRSISIASGAKYPLIGCWRGCCGGRSAMGIEGWLCDGASLQICSIHDRYRPDGAARHRSIRRQQSLPGDTGNAASQSKVPLDDWFEFTIGPPTIDLTAAPYGGARYSVETRMDGRIFARFHLDVGRRRGP